MKIKVYVIDVKMPSWVRRALVYAAIPAVILGLGALAYSAVSVPTFTDGAVLTAAPLNQLGQGITDLQSQITALNASAPYAVQAGHATSADSATNASHATNADSATLAATANVAKGMSVGTGGGTVVGTAPAGGVYNWQSGSFIGTSDAQGHLSFQFPTPFPNGVLSIVVTNGQSNIATIYGLEDQSLSGFKIGMQANALTRINWIAVGW